MKKLIVILCALMLVLGVVGIAGATLTTIGTATYSGNVYNLIYEDDQGLIWLDYTNGANTYSVQENWAVGLNTTGVLTYNLNGEVSIDWGSNDWRLPTASIGFGSTSPVYQSYNITDSVYELNHLYYVSLGNLAAYDTDGNLQSDAGLENTVPFVNLTEGRYWGEDVMLREYPFFDFNTGWSHDHGVSTFLYYALAVRNADVVFAPVSEPVPAPVPEPATMLLLASGLVGLAAFRRRLNK